MMRGSGWDGAPAAAVAQVAVAVDDDDVLLRLLLPAARFQRLQRPAGMRVEGELDDNRDAGLGVHVAGLLQELQVERVLAELRVREEVEG